MSDIKKQESNKICLHFGKNVCISENQNRGRN